MITAISAVMFVGFIALTADVGAFYVQKRKLQAATDLAAIAAAGALPDPAPAASRILSANGFSGANISALEIGSYRNDLSVPSAQRFSPTGANNANAVRLATAIATPMYFGKIFNLTGIASPARGATFANGSVPIGARAVAATSAEAAFGIGARLASLNGGVVNAILGQMLGANISLSAMDYQALASANIDAFKMTQALATRLSLTGLTYDQVAALSVRASDVYAAAAAVAPASASSRLQALSAATGYNATLKLEDLVSFGSSGALDISKAAPLASMAGSFDFVTAVAQLSNGAHQIDVDLGAQLPGLLSAKLTLSVGERPVWMVGPVGATIYTAQTRLRLLARIGGGALGVAINVPLYVDVAHGSATLSAASCLRAPTLQQSAQLIVKPGIVNAAIADVSNADIGNLASAPRLTPATLVSAPGILQATGFAQAAIGAVSGAPVSYSNGEILAVTRKTTTTSSYLASLTSSLVGKINLQIQSGGVALGTPGAVTAALASQLAAAARPLDSALFSILQTLGVGLGEADTWVSGVSCQSAKLVN
ncbi:MAG: hypothetical protein KGL46_13675 [Hyphomicrobiales bacterium]|nr:hypothetical protein [Hyphomicrobiales bacterium]